MDQKTRDDILESVETLKSWDQSLFVEHGGKKIDISCSVGSHATSPPDAPDQPKHYYRKTCYQFDTKFCGVEIWEPLQEMLSNACVGCKLTLDRGRESTNSRKQFVKTLCCKFYRVYDNSDQVHVFLDGQVAKMGIKEDTVKVQNTPGQLSGVESMHEKMKPKSTKKQIKRKRSDGYSENQPVSRRMHTSLASDSESRCHMKLKIFLGIDNYYYLASNSSLHHTGHPFMPPHDTKKSASDVSDEQLEWMQAMIDVGMNPSQVAEVIEKMHGVGVFESKMVQNMSAKMRKAKEKALGIGNDWSSVEKAMKYLDR